MPNMRMNDFFNNISRNISNVNRNSNGLYFDMVNSFVKSLHENHGKSSKHQTYIPSQESAYYTNSRKSKPNRNLYNTQESKLTEYMYDSQEGESIEGMYGNQEMESFEDMYDSLEGESIEGMQDAQEGVSIESSAKKGQHEAGENTAKTAEFAESIDDTAMEAMKKNNSMICDLLHFDRNSILQGVIFSEIINRPKFRRSR